MLIRKNVHSLGPNKKYTLNSPPAAVGGPPASAVPIQSNPMHPMVYCSHYLDDGAAQALDTTGV